jgi:hypothetical protein
LSAIKLSAWPVDAGRMQQRALGIVVGMAAVVAVAVALLALEPAEDEPLTPDQYREELVAALSHVDLAADPRDPRALREATGEFKELVGELTEFVPPPEVATTHARFVSGLNDYARMLERLSDAGPAGVIELQTRLAELGGLPGFDWVQAFSELAAQGYVTAGLVRP